MTLPKTEKLYLGDPYATSFHAEIIFHQPDEKTGGIAFVLDRSGFYPESGGQPADRGSIGGLRVVDVQEKTGEVLHHYVKAGPADVDRLSQMGKTAETGNDDKRRVECHIDWPRRLDHMQQHTGQHVLSRAFIETAGLSTVSFHLGEDTCTIDLEGDGFSDEVAAKAEHLANSCILENRAVVARVVNAASLEQLELRKAVPEGVAEARLVEIDGFDATPCCGTHVRGTGELGLIKILKSEKVKSARRVYFKVGKRALEDYRYKHDIVQRLATQMTTSPEGVVAKIEKQTSEVRQYKKDNKKLAARLMAYEKRELVDSAVDCGGVKLIVRFLPDVDEGYLRTLSSQLRAESATVAILGAENGSVVCCASDDVPTDFSRVAVALANTMGGSGGCKGPFAQLKLPGAVDVGEFMEKVGNNVKNSL